MGQIGELAKPESCQDTALALTLATSVPAVDAGSEEFASGEAKPNPLEVMVQTLQQAVTGMSQSFAITFRQISEKMEQTQEKMQSMTEMVEFTISSLVQVRSRVRYCPQRRRPALSLTIQNQNNLALEHVSLSLNCTVASSGEQQEVSIAASSELPELEPAVVRTDNVSFTGVTLVSQNSGKGLGPWTKPSSLEAMSSATWNFDLYLPELNEYNMAVTVSFLSPGSEKILRSTHRFGVYLVHQGIVKPKTRLEMTTLSSFKGEEVTLHISPSFARELLQRAPTEGLVIMPDGFYTLSYGDHFHIVIMLSPDVKGEQNRLQAVLSYSDSSIDSSLRDKFPLQLFGHEITQLHTAHAANIC